MEGGGGEERRGVERSGGEEWRERERGGRGEGKEKRGERGERGREGEGRIENGKWIESIIVFLIYQYYKKPVWCKFVSAL